MSDGQVSTSSMKPANNGAKPAGPPAGPPVSTNAGSSTAAEPEPPKRRRRRTAKKPKPKAPVHEMRNPTIADFQVLGQLTWNARQMQMELLEYVEYCRLVVTTYEELFGLEAE